MKKKVNNKSNTEKIRRERDREKERKLGRTHREREKLI